MPRAKPEGKIEARKRLEWFTDRIILIEAYQGVEFVWEDADYYPDSPEEAQVLLEWLEAKRDYMAHALTHLPGANWDMNQYTDVQILQLPKRKHTAESSPGTEHKDNTNVSRQFIANGDVTSNPFPVNMWRVKPEGKFAARKRRAWNDDRNKLIEAYQAIEKVWDEPGCNPNSPVERRVILEYHKAKKIFMEHALSQRKEANWNLNGYTDVKILQMPERKPRGEKSPRSKQTDTTNSSKQDDDACMPDSSCS